MSQVKFAWVLHGAMFYYSVRKHISKLPVFENHSKQVQQYGLEPTTGKAIPVLRGQVLRVKQVGKGQCLDFNAFNLHDYKEFFSLR